MNQIATQRQPVKSLRTMLEQDKIREDIGNALGGWMHADDFIAQIVIAFADPEVRACTIESQFHCAHTCAAFAFLPSLNHVALIPRNMKGSNQKVLTVMPQWQGYDALMRRNPEIEDLRCELVFPGDQFAYDGKTGQVEHNYDPFADGRVVAPGLKNIRGGYLEILYKNGRRKYHFLSREDILKRSRCAETQVVWQAWPREQAMKSIYRDAYARRAVSVDPLVAKKLEQVNQWDDKVLGNDPQRDANTRRSLEQRPQSRAERFATQMLPPAELTGPAPDPVEQTEPKQQKQGGATKKKSKGGGKSSSPPPPPDVPASIEEYAQAVHECTTADQVRQAFKTNIGTKSGISQEEFDAASDLADWKMAQLGGEKQGSLLDKES